MSDVLKRVCQEIHDNPMGNKLNEIIGNDLEELRREITPGNFDDNEYFGRTSGKIPYLKEKGKELIGLQPLMSQLIKE